MASAPTTVGTWARFMGSVRRALGFSVPETFIAGPDYTPATSEAPAYAVENSLSAFAAFPWVRACVDVIAADLAGLPLVVVKGRGATSERQEQHPVLELLYYPTSWQSGEEWRRQLVTYLLLCGNAYALQLSDGASLPLMHPERVKVAPGPFGGPAGYIYGLGQDVQYRPEDVLHWRLSSWEDGPQGLLGTGLIEALHNDLTADLAASKMVAKQASQGRPSAIISPKNGADLSEPDARQAVGAAYQAMILEGKSAIVLSGEVDLTFPTYTPRDMEFISQRGLTRETVLAAFGVPPTRVGLPTANYATSQQQDLTYWQGLVGLARLIDGQLSRLVRRSGQQLRIAHDFAKVQALQESRTERQNRAINWTLLGASEADAAAYEGFEDAPVGQVAPAPAPNPEQSAPAKGLEGLFVVARDEEPAHVATVPSSEIERAAVWSAWVQRAHTPSERRLQLATSRALRAQAARVAERLNGQRDGAAGVVQRDLVADILALIYPEGPERQALAAALGDALQATLTSGYSEGARGVGVGASWDPVRRDQVVLDQLGELVTRVSATTREALSILLQDALQQGQTIAEIQTRIQRAQAFSPARSLMIARTETTRAVAAGSAAAYQDAAAAGLRLRVQWLSARDGAVREAHAAMDGQTVDVGESFQAPDGERARFPGDFNAAGMVINCRCTTIAVVEEAA